MSRVHVAAWLFALSLVWLPAPFAAGSAHAASPTRVEGAIVGSSGGGYAYYSFSYPGDGSLVTLALEVGTADVDVIRATGLNVYGPVSGKVYATTAKEGLAQARTAAFTSTDPGGYVVQIYNYSQAAIPFSLASSRPLSVSTQSNGRPAERIVALDPGHGGPEIGAVSAERDLVEKHLNLKIALKLADLLRADGDQVVLTRDGDRAVHPEYRGGSSGGGVSADLQARIDVANAAGAHVFVSIHNNGGGRSESGTEVWYNRARPFADRNYRLAELVQSNLVAQIRALGYPVRDRGIKHDTFFRVVRGQAYNLYVLGPGTAPRVHTPTQMTGVLGESLFLSHPADAAMLRQERTLDAIARGYRDAIRAYFAAFPGA